MDDLLFSHRNKNYGAYLLRKSYSRNMSIGLAASIILFILMIIIPSINWENDQTIYKMTEVVLETPPDMRIPILETKPSNASASDSKIKLIAEKQIQAGEKPKVVTEDQAEPSKRKDEVLTDTTQKETSKVTVDPDSSKGNGSQEGEGDLPFDYVDVMPQFPGGQRSLVHFIQTKLVYPGSAFQNKIEGVVIVGFIIDKNGRLRNPKILKSLYPSCDEEALRVIKLIPDWIPAKNQGRNVSINFTMPIEFKLKR